MPSSRKTDPRPWPSLWIQNLGISKACWGSIPKSIILSSTWNKDTVKVHTLPLQKRKERIEEHLLICIIIWPCGLARFCWKTICKYTRVKAICNNFRGARINRLTPKNVNWQTKERKWMSSGHMINFELTEIGEDGRENIWLGLWHRSLAALDNYFLSFSHAFLHPVLPLSQWVHAMLASTPISPAHVLAAA